MIETVKVNVKGKKITGEKVGKTCQKPNTPAPVLQKQSKLMIWS
jgi:hypothetical protein